MYSVLNVLAVVVLAAIITYGFKGYRYVWLLALPVIALGVQLTVMQNTIDIAAIHALASLIIVSALYGIGLLIRRIVARET